MALGLLCFVPVAVEGWRDRDRRFYRAGTGAWFGWGVTLYLLGFGLASQVAQIAQAERVRRLRPPRVALPRAAGPGFQALNASLGFDRRLWPHDVAQSRAHARMLAAQGIICRRRPRRAAGRRSTRSRPSCADGPLPVRAPTTRTSTWPSSGG